MIIRRDEVFRVLCEFRTPNDKGIPIIGTGMFVYSSAGENGHYGWIVTASHVAYTTNDKTSIVIATQDGKAITLPLLLFGPLSGWRNHSIADISVFRILFTPENQQYTDNRFFPFDHFNLKKEVVSRDYELTAAGFPHGLGVDGLFSPFTFRSYASSGFVTLLRSDTNTPSDFFCLENPSVGGYSGCPVFDLGFTTNGVFATTKERTICHGIMHGTMCDETGGKIAMVTPAFYLVDLIDVA